MAVGVKEGPAHRTSKREGDSFPIENAISDTGCVVTCRSDRAVAILASTRNPVGSEGLCSDLRCSREDCGQPHLALDHQGVGFECLMRVTALVRKYRGDLRR